MFNTPVIVCIYQLQTINLFELFAYKAETLSILASLIMDTILDDRLFSLWTCCIAVSESNSETEELFDYSLKYSRVR